MTMEITSNYNYGVNYTNSTTTNENESKIYSSTKEYKKYLAETYECMQDKNYSVAINSSLLAKATSDEKTAQWLECNLSLIPKAMNDISSTVAARGSQIVSCNITMNGYDSMTTELVTKSEADPGTEKAREELEERIKVRREEKKEQEEKTAKRREEKKAEEKAAEKREESKEREEQLAEQRAKRKEEREALQSHEVTVVGSDVWSATEKYVEKANSSKSSAAVSGTVGFDIKA